MTPWYATKTTQKYKMKRLDNNYIHLREAARNSYFLDGGTIKRGGGGGEALKKIGGNF